MNYNYLFRNEELPNALSRKELHDLFEKLRQGDRSVREIIINHNLRLVIDVVGNRFKETNYDPEDLEAIGAIGLVKSVDTFNIDKKYSFSTYATTCIRNEILNFIRLEQTQKYQESLDKPIRIHDGKEDLYLKDMLVDEKTDLIANYVDKEMHASIRKILSTFPKRDQIVMDLYFRKFYTQQEIGNLFGFTRSNTYEIIKKSLQKIKLELQKQGHIEILSELSIEQSGKKR